jgi:hypothetical protein
VSKSKIERTDAVWNPDIIYCEFNKHDYYALIAVKKTCPYTNVYIKDFKLYVEIVSGEKTEEIRQQGPYDELTRDQALLKFLLASDNQDRVVKEILKEFDSIEDNIVLIDSSLV